MTLEIPAAHIQGAAPDRLTVIVPRDYQDAWQVLQQTKTYKASNQLYVKLAKVRKPRTTGEKSQNHHCNGHIMQLAAYTGDSFDDVKMYVKREAMSAGYPYHKTAFGDIVPNSEADASTEECAILIDTCHRVASFLGCKLKEGYDEGN